MSGPASQATADRHQLKPLERELKQARRANTMPRKAAADYAMTELGSQSS